MGFFKKGGEVARDASDRSLPLSREEANGFPTELAQKRQSSVLEITTADNKSKVVDMNQPKSAPGSPMKKAPTVVRLARENGSTEVLFGDSKKQTSNSRGLVSFKDVSLRRFDQGSQGSGSERSGTKTKKPKKNSVLGMLGNETGQAPNLVLMGDRYAPSSASDRASTVGSSISQYGMKYVPGRSKAVFAIKGSTMVFLDKSLEEVFGSIQSSDSKPHYRMFLVFTCGLMMLLSLVEAGNSASAKPYQIAGWITMLIGGAVCLFAGVGTTYLPWFLKTHTRFLLMLAVLLPLVSLSFFFNWSIDNEKDDMMILDLFCWGGYVWTLIPFRFSMLVPLFSCFLAVIFSLEVLHGHKPPMDNYFFLAGKIVILNISGLFGGFIMELALRRSVFAQQSLVSRIKSVTSYIEIMKAIPNLHIPWSVYNELVDITDESSRSAENGHGGDIEEEASGSSHDHVRDWEEIDFPIVDVRRLNGVKFLSSIERCPVVIIKPLYSCAPADMTTKQIQLAKAQVEAWHQCLLEVGLKHNVERLSARGVEFMGFCPRQWPESVNSVMDFVEEVVKKRMPGIGSRVKVGVGGGSLSLLVLGINEEVRVVAMGHAVDEAYAMVNNAQADNMVVGGMVQRHAKGSSTEKIQEKQLSLDPYVVRLTKNNENGVNGGHAADSGPRDSQDLLAPPVSAKAEENSLRITWDYAWSNHFLFRCLAFFGLYHDLHPKINFFQFKKNGLNSLFMVFQKGELRYLKFSIQFFLKNPTVRGLIVVLLIVAGWMMAVVAMHGEGWDNCLNDTGCYVPFIGLMLVIPPSVLLSLILSNIHPFLLMSALAFGSAALQALGLAYMPALDSDKAKASLIRYNVLWCAIGIFALNIPCPFAVFYCAGSFLVNEAVAWSVVPAYQCANGFITRAVIYAMFALFAFKRDMILRRMYMINHILAEYETHADSRLYTVLEYLNALYANRVVKMIYERNHQEKVRRTTSSKRRRFEEHDDISLGVIQFKATKDIMDARFAHHMHILAERLMESAQQSNVEVLQMSGDTMVLAMGIAEEGPHTNNVLLGLAVEAHLVVAEYNAQNETTFCIGVGLGIGAILEFLCGMGEVDYHVVGDEMANTLDLARSASNEYINVTQDFLELLHIDDSANARESVDKHVMFSTSAKHSNFRSLRGSRRQRISLEKATQCAQDIVRTGVVKYSLDHDQDIGSLVAPGVMSGGKQVVLRSKDMKKTKRKFGWWRRSSSNDSEIVTGG